MVDGNAEDQWLLAPAERELVGTKNRANRLGFAILLTFFRERGRFPRDETEVEAQGIAALSKLVPRHPGLELGQVGVDAVDLEPAHRALVAVGFRAVGRHLSAEHQRPEVQS